jgi:competence protein ComEA
VMNRELRKHRHSPSPQPFHRRTEPAPTGRKDVATMPQPTEPNGDLPPLRNGTGRTKMTVIYTVIGVIVMALVGSGIAISALAGGENKPDSRLASAKVTPTPTLVMVTPTPPPTPTLAEIKVYITGEVKNPGVYTMKQGERIEDAVKAAGGFTENADPQRVDLAARVRDEMRIIVPKLNQPSFEPLVSGGSNPPPTPGDGKINVNTASTAELDKLPGIGAVLSQRIVEYRAKIGPYKSVEDLRKIPGITNAVIEKIKDLISF